MITEQPSDAKTSDEPPTRRYQYRTATTAARSEFAAETPRLARCIGIESPTIVGWAPRRLELVKDDSHARAI